MSLRTKSNSVCEADGKPTSISLKPMATSISNMRSLRATSIGSISAWLPSRRSTLHQTGGRDSTASGQVRSVNRTGAKGRYLLAGLFNMVISLGYRQTSRTKKNGPLLVQTGRGQVYACATVSARGEIAVVPAKFGSYAILTHKTAM